jgi:hypothetical protein
MTKSAHGLLLLLLLLLFLIPIWPLAPVQNWLLMANHQLAMGPNQMGCCRCWPVAEGGGRRSNELLAIGILGKFTKWRWGSQKIGHFLGLGQFLAMRPRPMPTLREHF